MLTPFLRSLVERGLDVSQGVLVILDGGQGLRAAVRQASLRYRPVRRDRHRCRERDNVVSRPCRSTSRRRGVSVCNAPTTGAGQ